MTTTSNASVERLLLDEDFIAALNPARHIHERGRWPCELVSIDPSPAEPFIAAYRCRFTLTQLTTFRLHLTADERYDLYLDGQLIGRGPERGEGGGWTPVKTVMPILRSANDWRDWGFGTPMLRPSILPAMRETDRHVGRVRHIDAPAITADDTQNNRSAWHARLLDQRPLVPAPVLADNDLPCEHAAWNALLRDRQPLLIAPRTLRRVIIDLDDYYCAYPLLQVSGGAGADVYWQWAESLFTRIDDHQYPHPKHNRGEIENKVFPGICDWFEPDGAAHRLFTPHW
ncbi:MAG: hypothetical protein WC058_13770 [Phycisphaeraceae bacterium]